MAERGGEFDVVSVGELCRVLQAEDSLEKPVFAGVGKTNKESQAEIEAGVLKFNVESEAELWAIVLAADSTGKVAAIKLRVNTDSAPETHRYISTGKKELKFGTEIVRAERAAEAPAMLSSIRMIRMHIYIGSPITMTEPYTGAFAKRGELIGGLRRLGHPIAWYNMGGGCGIKCKGREALAVEEFAQVIGPEIRTVSWASNRWQRKQPGQPCGIYQAVGGEALPYPGCHHERFDSPRCLSIVPSDLVGDRSCGDDAETTVGETKHWDVIGPVWESGDFLAEDCLLPRLVRGSLLAIFSADTYGMVMAFNYNARPYAPEIHIDRSHSRLVRCHETY